MAAAIVEFDALPDAVRPTAEDDDLVALRGTRFASEGASERRLVGRIHVGCRRGEFGGASVDPLVDRRDPSYRAGLGDFALLDSGERGEPRVRKARCLEEAQIYGVPRQAMGAHLLLERDDVGQALQEPGIDSRDLVDFGDAHAEP